MNGLLRRSRSPISACSGAAGCSTEVADSAAGIAASPKHLARPAFAAVHSHKPLHQPAPSSLEQLPPPAALLLSCHPPISACVFAGGYTL